jgi:hypothetical protein
LITAVKLESTIWRSFISKLLVLELRERAFPSLHDPRDIGGTRIVWPQRWFGGHRTHGWAIHTMVQFPGWGACLIIPDVGQPARTKEQRDATAN